MHTVILEDGRRFELDTNQVAFYAFMSDTLRAKHTGLDFDVFVLSVKIKASELGLKPDYFGGTFVYVM